MRITSSKHWHSEAIFLALRSFFLSFFMMTTEDLFRQIKAHHVKSQLLCVTVPNPPPKPLKKKNNILNKLNLSVLFDLLWHIVVLRLLLSLLCLLKAEGQPHPHTWNYSEQTFNSPISMQPYLRVHFRVCEYLHVCASLSHTERKEKGNLAQGLYFSLYSTAHENPLARLKCLCWCCYNCMS